MEFWRLKMVGRKRWRRLWKPSHLVQLSQSLTQSAKRKTETAKLEAITSRVEAIAARLEAFAPRLEANKTQNAKRKAAVGGRH